MLCFDWLSHYSAICCSPLEAKFAHHIFNVLVTKKELRLALTRERCFVSIFFWPTSWFLLKQFFLSSRPHSLWVNTPFGLRAHGLTPFLLFSSLNFPRVTWSQAKMRFRSMVTQYCDIHSRSYLAWGGCPLMKKTAQAQRSFPGQ